MANQVLRYIDKIRKYPWEEILKGGTVFVGLKERGQRRRYIYFKGKRYIYTIVLWNVEHPDDLVGIDDVIHHIDGNPLNDLSENLVKMSRAGHRRYHSTSNKSNFLTKTTRRQHGQAEVKNKGEGSSSSGSGV